MNLGPEPFASPAVAVAPVAEPAVASVESDLPPLP